MAVNTTPLFVFGYAVYVYTARMMADQNIEVRAFWDEEAKVWVAESEQVPGLATEAETFERLATKLESLIPELLELNATERQRTYTVNLKAERILHAL